jgi:hypothetical protein
MKTAADSPLKDGHCMNCLDKFITLKNPVHPNVLFPVKAAMLIGWQDHRIHRLMMFGLNWPSVFRVEDLQIILC